MNAREIRPGIFWVGVNDRTTDLFEGVWPLPHGVSYNAYLVIGERVALIDTVKAHFAEDLLRNISQVISLERLDYIVVNHMEPDHSGALPAVLRQAPSATVLATPQALPMLASFYGITERVKPVSDGERIDLGGKALAFHHIPFVHWPETMATYEETERVLFTCDAFGGFHALDGVLFDDEVEVWEYEDEILRYFSNIVGMHSRPVLRAIEKLKGLDIAVIAPSHGLVWRRDPVHILEMYSRWARMEALPEVTLVFGSMYGFTSRMAEAVARGVKKAGLKVKVLDAARTHVSFLIREAWKRKGLIIGAPTYDTGIFPPVEYFLRLLERKRLRDRVVGVFGSYGWKGGAVDKIMERVGPLGWEVVDTLGFHGAPSPDDLARAESLGEKVATRVREAASVAEAI